MSTVELIADYACLTGENPLWHPVEKRLYWCDIPKGRMFRYDPATGKHEPCYQGEQIGGFTLQADGSLLLFGERGAIRVWREGGGASADGGGASAEGGGASAEGIVRTVVAEIPEERESRFNDVIADPAGRVFCGTMPRPDGTPGSLYRLDTDGTLTRLFGGIGCSNGMGFTPDRKHLYYTDSKPREVYLFDYDERTGSLSNRKLFLRLPEGNIPDGMTVDSEGSVWTAIWGGSCIIRYSSEGKELERIALPAKLCASLAFAGPDYADLYVTCAGGDDKTANGPGAGGLYRVRATGRRGVPEFASRVLV